MKLEALRPRPSAPVARSPRLRWAHRSGWLVVLPVTGVALGLLVHGPWALAGAVAGAAALLLARGMGVGPLGAGVAGLVPPLAATGPVAAAAAVFLGLALAWQRTGQPWVFLLGVAGAVIPAPAGPAIAAAGAAGFLATAPYPALLLAVPVAMAPATAGVVPAPGALALVAAALARWVAAHPANATMGDHLVRLGLAGAVAPAAVAYLFALVAQPEHFWAVAPVALGAGLAGLALLCAHLGLAVLLRSTGGHPALWTSAVWTVPAFALGLVAILGPRAAMVAAAPFLAFLAVPMGIGVAAVLAFVERRNRAEIFLGEGLHRSTGAK